MLNEYALYYGDNLIEIGTAEELAQLTNVKTNTIYFMTTPAYKKRRMKSKRDFKIVVKVSEKSEYEIIDKTKETIQRVDTRKWKERIIKESLIKNGCIKGKKIYVTDKALAYYNEKSKNRKTSKYFIKKIHELSKLNYFEKE